MKIGIDAISFDTPGYYLDLVDLARARGDEPDKYTIGIGQDQQAVPPSSQDVVTMGANAAQKLLDRDLIHDVGMLILGTESGIDASKAGALYIQHLLGLPEWLRAIEIKEACYGGTAGLMMARDYVAAHPDKTALVIAADIARYGLKTAGEVTQGAGAIAMVVSADPRIMTIESDSVFRSEEIMDFWRPVYSDTAIAFGKYSTEQYLAFFDSVWARYKQETGRRAEDFAALTFHLPYTKMGLKALKHVLPEADDETQARLQARFQASIQFSRAIGNIYAGALYLGLLSLFDRDDSLQAGDRIGLFSYGSGAVAEFFSGILQPHFAELLTPAQDDALLAGRKQVSVDAYEEIFNDKVPYARVDYNSDPQYYTGRFVLTGVHDQQRQYVRRA